MSQLFMVPHFLLYFPLANRVGIGLWEWFMDLVIGTCIWKFQLFNYLKDSDDLEQDLFVGD